MVAFIFIYKYIPYKMKHIELFKDGFDSTVQEKIQPENWPYVGHDMVTGEIVYTVIPEEKPLEYKIVDLGLPSGLKWSDRNIGAETPQAYGLYFDWGNIDGHAVGENNNTIDGYSFDKNTYYTTLGGQYKGSELDAEHDAATVYMGSDWRMPTVVETLELIQNTDHYYIGEDGSIVAGPFDHTVKHSDKGLDGSKLRSICFVKKDETFYYDNRSNFIEFPIAGFCDGSLLDFDGWNGYVWASSVRKIGEGLAYSMSFSARGYLNGDGLNANYFGHPVRGVHA